MKKYILLFVILLVSCNIPTTVETPLPPPTMDSPTQVQSPVSAAPEASSTQQVVGPEIQPLPAGPLTIVALGDSLTAGDGDDSGRGYPGRLLDMVNAVRPDSTLTNYGQSGWTSDALINGDQGIASQLDRAVAELENAAGQGRVGIALIWIGSNDLWYLYEYGGDINDEGDAHDLQRFTSNMDQILSRLRDTGAGVIVSLLDDQSKRPVALKGEAFVSITPDELARMSVQVTRYNQVIVEKAAQYGALTVDFYNTDIFINPATLYDDGNHPNQAGYDIIAQKWFEQLILLIQ